MAALGDVIRYVRIADINSDGKNDLLISELSSMDKQSWQIVPNSVVNTTNTNVATTTTQTEGYYVIVAGIPTGITSTSSAPILEEHTIDSPAPPPSLMPEVTAEPSVSPVPFETEKTQRCILWWCW